MYDLKVFDLPRVFSLGIKPEISLGIGIYPGVLANLSNTKRLSKKLSLLPSVFAGGNTLGNKYCIPRGIGQKRVKTRKKKRKNEKL
jgi:hypothetical protein